jgi:hypothetical protein
LKPRFGIVVVVITIIAIIIIVVVVRRRDVLSKAVSIPAQSGSYAAWRS